MDLDWLPESVPGTFGQLDSLESLHIDNLIAIKNTDAYSNLVLQIRVAPISGLKH